MRRQLFHLLHQSDFFATNGGIFVHLLKLLRLTNTNSRYPEVWSLLSDMAVDKVHDSVWENVKLVYDKFLYQVSNMKFNQSFIKQLFCRMRE